MVDEINLFMRFLTIFKFIFVTLQPKKVNGINLLMIFLQKRKCNEDNRMNNGRVECATTTV